MKLAYINDKKSMPDEVTHYQLLKLLEEKPELTQRQLAGEMGISLGKVNYCLRALINKGCVKAGNFKNSKNKKAYAYLLTTRGIEEKTKLALSFLKRKITEYELLKHEIEQLRSEVEEMQEASEYIVEEST